MDLSSLPNASSSAWLRQAIEHVTDPVELTEDWSMIMEICDEVAVQQYSAEEAMRTIQKKLQTKTTDQGWRSIALTLTLLEALVKNCGGIFHIQLANKDFLHALKAIIAPKNHPPLPIEEQILGMTQYWAFAFGNEPGFGIIKDFYQDCKQQGYKFPSIDERNVIKVSLSSGVLSKHPTSDSRTQSQPPSKTMGRPKTSVASSNRNNSVDANLHEFDRNRSPIIRNLSDEQLARLRSELDLVYINLDVFEDMISNLEPAHEHPDDWELFTELYKTCKQMQARIVNLLSLVAIDDVAVDFLRCNDRLNKAFNDYRWYMEKRERFWQPLVPHSNIMDNDRESISHTLERVANDLDGDNDSDSNEYGNQLKTLSTGGRSILANCTQFLPTEHSANPRKLSPRYSAVPTRHRLAEEHSDQPLLPTKLQNMRLTPLPNPVPRLTVQEKVPKRALSAASSVKIGRNRERTQVFDGTVENIDFDNNIRSNNERDHGDTRTGIALSAEPSTVKRLTTNNDSSVDYGYKITGYHHVKSDSNK